MNDLVSAILLLLLVMDPIGNVPVFLGYLKDVKEERRKWIVARESCFAFAILFAFLLCGPKLMAWLAIKPESLHISGGVLLFLISLGMIFPGAGHLGSYSEAEPEGEPFIVPLAVPFIAGPSTMATIMIFSTRHESFMLWLEALFIAWIISTLILILSSGISRLLGPRGMRACERLMGMVLTVVAVQMSLDGIRLFLQHKS